MTTLQIFGYTAGILSIIALAPYLRDIFRGTTKPERATWLIWAVLGSIAFFSQLAKGATDSLWMTGGQNLVVVIVLLLSIKYGVGGLLRRDILALVVTAFGLVLWYFTKEAALALFIVIFVDAIGAWLTVVKTYKDPSSETASTWAMLTLTGILGMLAVGTWDWILLAYPLYIALANFSVLLAIILGGRYKKQIYGG